MRALIARVKPADRALIGATSCSKHRTPMPWTPSLDTQERLARPTIRTCRQLAHGRWAGDRVGRSAREAGASLQKRGRHDKQTTRLLFLYIMWEFFSGAGAPHDAPQPLLRDPHTSRSFTNQPCDTSSASNSARSSTSYKHSLVKTRAARTPPRARRRCLDSLSSPLPNPWSRPTSSRARRGGNEAACAAWCFASPTPP